MAYLLSIRSITWDIFLTVCFCSSGIVLIGEIGGTAEEDAAALIKVKILCLYKLESLTDCLIHFSLIIILINIIIMHNLTETPVIKYAHYYNHLKIWIPATIRQLLLMSMCIGHLWLPPTMKNFTLVGSEMWELFRCCCFDFS